MHKTPSLSEADLLLIRNLTYNPALKPSYEILKNCLVWEDERPEGLTSEGYEFLCDMWIVRSHFHRQLDLSKTLDPAHFENTWRNALKLVPAWPGFKRLTLTNEDRIYYEESMRNVRSFLES